MNTVPHSGVKGYEPNLQFSAASHNFTPLFPQESPLFPSYFVIKTSCAGHLE